MALAAVVGLFVVYYQLNQFKKQNETLEATYRATYRPIGEISFEGGQPFDCKFIPPTVGDWSFSAKPVLRNIGRDLLIYVGSLSYLCYDTMDFRRHLLEGQVDTVVFDGVLPDTRLQPIKIDAGLRIYLKQDVLGLKRDSYLYSLFLYSDLAGNIYDTQRMDYLKLLADSTITQLVTSASRGDSAIIIHPVLDTDGLRSAQTYHSYTDDEKEQLIRRLREQNGHPMADVIENL
jgi:hypothetical protein